MPWSLAAMQGDDADQMQQAMEKAIDDANQLSQNQERLHEEVDQLAGSSMMMHDQAAAQQDLQASCSGLKNRIGELGKKSPFVAAELERLVDDARRQMDLATESLSGRRKSQAMRYQRDSMSSLNRAAIRLMESLENQKQCNKGGNCDKPSQQLSAMCNKQNQLNQMTQQQCQNPGQANPTFDQQANRQAMQRLAGEQGALRKSLEELDREFGDSRQILGRLDAIAEEMRQVEEELSTGEAGQSTLEKQLKIYSRLLEASRSLQRRDFTEQRQATTGRDNLMAAPPALPADLLGDRLNLEDRLRQYMSEEYPAQYEEQIKAYFRALLQNAINGSSPVPTTSTGQP
jgi:predicted nuclease with TOPRIM domain